ncbi:complement C1q-like protein 4 [Saccostrea cucullata]|uniref:complement C1q-like protein 4 n=1 Tax=Saccostrea cuccullata TaxID=36930 RepID=UPI002ED2EFA6
MHLLYTFVLFFGIMIQPTKSKILDPKELIKSISSYKEACSAVGYEKRPCSYRSKNNKMAVAFHAKMTNAQNNLKSSQKVLFEHVFLNIGGGYNAKTGVFTAPVDGIYRFDWTILAAMKKYYITLLVKEDTQIGSNYCADTSDNELGQCSSSAIVEMKANQKVWIKPYNSYAQGVKANWSYFSGHILF